METNGFPTVSTVEVSDPVLGVADMVSVGELASVMVAAWAQVVVLLMVGLGWEDPVLALW